jgi:hypothetical protein
MQKKQQLQKSLTHRFSIFISASHAKFFFIIVKFLLLRLALIFQASKVHSANSHSWLAAVVVFVPSSPEVKEKSKSVACCNTTGCFSSQDNFCIQLA